MSKVKYSIAQGFSRHPGPRQIIEGANSGELFRTKVFRDLVRKAIQEESTIVLDLDGTAGYGTSFLEECFGGLIREDGIPYEALVNRFEFISNEEPYLINDILAYLKDAHEEAQDN